MMNNLALWTRRLALSAVLLTIGSPSSASAETDNTALSQSPAPKKKDDGCLRDNVCRTAYQKALALYDEGRYEEALAGFQGAYARRQMPWLLLNASFMDFLMPYASEVPHVETDHLETPSPLNPLGLKGAGEAGTIPVTAVIASAIEDAEGFPVRSMPISPSELWELRRKHAESPVPVPAQEGSR